jgi:DNA uptake protein ComE-like DNA-binding protein
VKVRLSQPRRSSAPSAGGFILIAVLVVVMLASMVVVTLLFRLRAEETATAAGAGAEQAWASAMSGVYEAMRVVSASTPGSLDWQDAPSVFRERLVLDDGADRWYFSVYSAGENDLSELRFGLTDEASRLNINQATEEMVEKLPKMTPYLAQGLLDFLDADNTPRPEGAEQEYYDALPTPYTMANGPLSTLDQLLLVRGFTPALLYGEDANWNYQLDPNEDDAQVQFPPDNKDGKLELGLRQYLTIYSYDLNNDNAGNPRVDPNQATDESEGLAQDSKGAEELPASLREYLDALRRNKVKLAQPVDLLEAKGKFKDESGVEVELESGVGKAELPLVLDRFTTKTERRLPGLVNVNTASAKVLQTLPGVDEAMADSIAAARRNLRLEQRRTPAWLYQEGLLDADQFKKLLPFLTARGLQFHFRVVGYAAPSGKYRVLEATIDVGGTQPTVVYLRDITRLGLPFRIEMNTDGSGTSGPSDTELPSTRDSASKPPSRAQRTHHG